MSVNHSTFIANAENLVPRLKTGQDWPRLGGECILGRRLQQSVGFCLSGSTMVRKTNIRTIFAVTCNTYFVTYLFTSGLAVTLQGVSKYTFVLYRVGSNNLPIISRVANTVYGVLRTEFLSAYPNDIDTFSGVTPYGWL